MKKKFVLQRNLKAGMVGEDVKKFQHWLNIVQTAYEFSNTYPNGVIENGQFTTFITNLFYHQFLDMAGYPINHVYDKVIHEELCYHVNMALQSLGNTQETWACT